MPAIFIEHPETPEGKYLVKRRDGSVPAWPHFVIAASDPIAPWVLRFYALLALVAFRDRAYAGSIWRLARSFKAWRKQHWTGDPNAPRHRTDDPATVNEMRKGSGA